MYITESRTHHLRDAAHWYTFSHVCSTWRTIAIHNPILWRDICFDHPRWTLEMLRHADRTPLSVCLIPPTIHIETLHILYHIIQHPRSIDDLQITTTSASTMLHIIKHTSKPAIMLHSLTIAVMCNPDSRQQSTRHTIPSRIYDGFPWWAVVWIHSHRYSRT